MGKLKVDIIGHTKKMIEEYNDSLKSTEKVVIQEAESMNTKANYDDKAREYADKRGIIFYEIKGNIMSYEEQVKDSRTSYGLYNAEVNLDTGVVTQVKVG